MSSLPPTYFQKVIANAIYSWWLFYLDRIHTYAHRAHTHDVHALTVCGEVLLSGGVDSKLCAYSVQNFARVRPRWIPSLPANRSNFYLHPTLFLHSDSGVLFIRLVQHTESYGVIAIQQRHSVEVWTMNDNVYTGALMNQ